MTELESAVAEWTAAAREESAWLHNWRHIAWDYRPEEARAEWSRIVARTIAAKERLLLLGAGLLARRAAA